MAGPRPARGTNFRKAICKAKVFVSGSATRVYGAGGGVALGALGLEVEQPAAATAIAVVIAPKKPAANWRAENRAPAADSRRGGWKEDVFTGGA